MRAYHQSGGAPFCYFFLFTIGGRIKAARKALGMTQEDLAELMCSTGALICCYEKDKVDLSLSVIRLLAKNLGVSAAYLC